MIATADVTDSEVLTLRREFQSMPALVLTAPQVARLLAIRVDRAKALLAALEAEGWLIRSGEKYRRSEPALT